MNIAVTGAASFIGAALHRLCRVRGIGWTGLDASPAGTRHTIVADISAAGDWMDALPEGADAIVHLAAISRDADCRRDPVRAFEVNLIGTLRVIEAARRRGIPQIVFASSEWVYGDIDASLKNERAPIDAASLSGEYALSKLAGERLLSMQKDLATTVLRFGIVYGPRASGWSAVEALHDAVCRQDRVEVGCLETARRFVHVDDIAAGIVSALGRPAGFEIFNLTGDRLVTLGDIIEESARLVGRSPSVAERTPGRASVRNIDNTRARQILGWIPRLSLRQGLETLAAVEAVAQ